MITFWVRATFSSDDAANLRESIIYKEFAHPVIPSVGQWIDLGEGTAAYDPVVDVWHRLGHESQNSKIIVDVFLAEYEIENFINLGEGWVLQIP
ncbi:MAG: hypothetical protein ACI9H6_000346 [Patiriisocius sp.]|jgi:hypothetical protein